MHRRLIIFVFITGSFVLMKESLAQGVNNQLQRIDSSYKINKREADQRVEKYLKSKNSFERIAYRRDGSIMALEDVSSFGVPIYTKSNNAGVATSLNIDKLRNNGSLGLNLQGAGIQIGIWDEGKIRNDHIELVGRVTQIDSPSASNDHATHVLGTIMATGINTNAMGMAPKATAIAFDFFGDVGEMISQAAPDQTSLILSNHSYGTVSGWDNDSGTWTWYGDPNISPSQDWKFGFYDQTSGFYDDIAFNAPYYLIVKAAGNDANDIGDGSRDPDCNPFDCIPTSGVAKNILTIGAVKKITGSYTGPADVVIASFSSLGPTDDGRIKPDVVAPGQAVFSTSATSSGAYTTFSGTSMCTPATTGTLALLQELHKNLDAGNLMKSATLKALAIHTAREAGVSTGPDFTYGWGLLDAEAAAKILMDRDNQNIFVKELSLDNGQVFEMDLSPKQNTKITATLVWTDPAGTVLAPSLNPTIKMLRNDLDVRLIDDGGTIKFPWILNSSNPAVAATKGDNIVDNVEKLEFDDPEPRNYKLKVSHKGSLVGDRQDFSLIISYASVVDPRISYYWVGDTGNWDNGANWSLSSGGALANTVPTINDKVVFDENSFSSDNQTVSLTQSQQCFSIRWFANENTNLSFNGNELAIADELNILSENISTTSPGTILFNGVSATETMVNLNNGNFQDLNLKFSGPEAKWFLPGNFEINELEMVEGSLSIDNNSIKLNSLSSSGALSKSIILNNASISGLSNLSMDLSGIDLTGTGNTIEIPANSSYTVDLGTNFFNGSLDLLGGEINVLGSGEIHKVQGFGTLVINGNHTWNDFSLDAGSVIRIEESSVQKISNSFLLTATTGSRITLESSGALIATLDFTNHSKICLDNLDIENIAVIGESIVNAGINSNLTSSPNWLQDSCENILFPDFGIQFNCEKAAVFFVDGSSGPEVTRNWNFGDNGSPQNESAVVNPIHFYESGGQYLVSLEISNGSTTASYSKIIDLNGTQLDANKIELSNGKLISFLPANNYQWVLNGELLENTDLRSIDFSNGFGLYAVLTFDENCNRQSDTFLVTGVDENSSSQSILVYPNPAHDLLFVKDGKRHVRDLRLLNSIGQQMLMPRGETEGGWEVDISDIQSGVYFLQVQTEFNTSYYRIIVK